jgi:hypothetical protein
MLNEQASIFSKRNSKSTAIFTTKPRSKFKVYVDDSSQDDNLFVPKSFTDKYRSLAERSNSTDDIRKDIYNNDSNQVYITNLPNECLYYIFMLCDDLSTKCNITQVCKKWRLLMLNSSNVRTRTRRM